MRWGISDGRHYVTSPRPSILSGSGNKSTDSESETDCHRDGGGRGNLAVVQLELHYCIRVVDIKNDWM